MLRQSSRPAVAGPSYPLTFYRDWHSSRKNGKDIAAVRIPNFMMEGAAFLFPSKAAAEKRAKIGGSAFVVSKLIRDSKELAGQELFVPYFVSCKHVVFAAGASMPSVNRWDGGKPDLIEYEPTDWTEHPDGDDLVAVCAMNKLLPSRHKISHIDSRSIITGEGYANPLEIGAGDQVFMVGRFINHQGHETNRAAARFGSISMMPEKIWVSRDSRYQDSFAVEMRSRTGFSGSPVAVYRTVATTLADVKTKDFWGILGVNWGFILDDDGENTWLNGVVPGWKILDLLEMPALKSQHEKYEDQFHYLIKEQGGDGAVQAFAGEPVVSSVSNDNPNHLADFTRLVDVAARKRPQGG
jgi:hypothetical protein